MKSKLLIMVLIGLFLSACSYPKYLPSANDIDVNQYGSYISLNMKNGKYLSGELISIDYNTLVVLSESTHKCESFPVSEIHKFSLRYAKSKPYGWTIPFVLALPFIHGGFSILTIPIHLIVTISATASSHSAFVYKDNVIGYDELQKFARFPQGIPASIELNSIK